ncbi:MAG: OsmC family protein [Fimbriimonadaceae bacterium]
MPTLHEYPISLEWSGGREGHGAAVAENSGSTFNLAVPSEFQGAGGGTNPEELLTTAISACYTITFGIIAANRKLPIESIDVTATGVVEQNGASFVYKSIAVQPVITLATDASEEQVAQAEDMAHKADSYCIVTNAVRGKVEVIIEPSVTRSQSAMKVNNS